MPREFLYDLKIDITHNSRRDIGSCPPSCWILALSATCTMAGLLRISALPRVYSRLFCRKIQTSSARQYKPVPTTRPEYASELEALQAKEKGPWSELSKQEKVDRKFLYVIDSCDRLYVG